MVSRRELPEQLQGGPFSSADARARGVSAGRLSASDLHAPFRGVRVPTGSELSLADRCRAYQLVAHPSAFFSQLTAARLLGVPLSREAERARELHLSVPPQIERPRGKFIRGHQARVGPGDRMLRAGLRISGPERTWLDLGALLAFEDLVVAADYLVKPRRFADGVRPYTTIGRLREALSAYAGRRGRRRLGEALEAIRVGVDSPQETRLRLILQAAGFPELTVNEYVRDDFGYVLAKPDLGVKGYSVGLEYQGDHHRTDRTAWQRDVIRGRELSSVGWHTIDVVAPDLQNPRELIALLAHKLRARGWQGRASWPPTARSGR